jgi:hypothetical protein
MTPAGQPGLTGETQPIFLKQLRFVPDAQKTRIQLFLEAQS